MLTVRPQGNFSGRRNEYPVPVAFYKDNRIGRIRNAPRVVSTTGNSDECAGFEDMLLTA